MIMRRKRKGSKAAVLGLSLCIAFTSALSAGAGPLTAYAAEQTLGDDLKDEANSKNENASTDKEDVGEDGETESVENSDVDNESKGTGDVRKTQTTQSAEVQKDAAKETSTPDTEKSQSTEKTQDTAKSASTQGTGKVQGSESSQTATTADKTNHAILVHLAPGYSLDAVPKQDAESLQKILYNTDQFDESQASVQLFSIPENDEKNDYKQKLWDEIDKIAKDTDNNSFTVFAYSGHGGALGDGTSSLALGGINNISAAELRQHLNKLSGRVLVILSCCHSGGMIMPASEWDETEGDSQTESDVFDEEEFLEEFFNQEDEISPASESADAAGDASENGNANSVSEQAGSATKEPPQYYFFAAANRAETATQLEGIGGQDNAALGHALGFDRNNASYHVFAADTTTLKGATSREGYAGDGQVTMRELADFYQKYNRIHLHRFSIRRKVMMCSLPMERTMEHRLRSSAPFRRKM